MPIIEPLMQRVVEASSATEVLVLSNQSPVGIKIKGLHILNAPSASAGNPVFATLVVDAKKVGFYRIDSLYGNHLGYKDSNTKNDSLFTYLVRKGIFPPIPLAQGQEFRIQFSSAYTGKILVTYEIWDPQDVQKTAPLGTESSEIYYINYGTNDTTINADGFYELKRSWNPEGFPRFPFGERVPAGYQITIFACLAQEVGRYVDSSNYCITKRLKYIAGLEELFDIDRQGFLLEGAYSTTAGYYYGTGKNFFAPHREDKGAEIKFFDPPLVYGPGEELKLYVLVDVTGSNGTFPAGTIDVPLLMHAKPIR